MRSRFSREMKWRLMPSGLVERRLERPASDRTETHRDAWSRKEGYLSDYCAHAQNDATNDAMPVSSFLSSFWVSFHSAVTSPASHTFELHEPPPTEAI